MSRKVVLVLGGARSGKSRFAQEMAGRLSGKVLFVATAEALDKEMHERIEEHRRTRSASWRTLEAPREVGRAISADRGDAEVVLVDCITLLVSNLLLANDGETHRAELAVDAEINALIRAWSAREAVYVVVSNEVGLGLVPDNDLGRAYRDLLGKANQTLASAADEVYLMTAGIPSKIKG